MAPFYKTAAAFCLVGLFGLQCGAQTPATYKYEVAKVGEDAYLTVNLARNGQISAKTSLVEKDTELVGTLETKVKADEAEPKASCDELLTEDLKKLFNVTVDNKDNPDYRKLVQDALNTGLTDFGATYPADTSAWRNIWGNAKLLSVLHLLGASSTKVACVIANCVKTAGDVGVLSESDDAPEKSVLFCELKPAAAENEAAFSEEYFKELKERTTQLKDMKEEDLEDPIVTSSANVAVPSILTAGLGAILAAISA
ncbi:uncharacterized protein EMH_0051220 [Eimeria mitis]|uniref:SAG family member n=1 Tax=Eimeria mitis TaxID=44415 RepID=U6JZX2_9EIME|nr:uncharacterized protein EMH_0051220 [Eimeria mitis]CDJ29612.1 hypothetical protein EMH_0051220 [Eimeria mitis]